MIDRHFTLALLACTLFGGTVAIGSELMQRPTDGALAAQARIATLPRVVVVGHKQPAATTLAEAGTAAIQVR